MSHWNRAARVCGNCGYWPLSPYGQACWERGELNEPSGLHGHQTDGSVSDCRRHAPCAIRPQRESYDASAQWPRTARTDSCGDFKWRGP